MKDIILKIKYKNLILAFSQILQNKYYIESLEHLKTVFFFAIECKVRAPGRSGPYESRKTLALLKRMES